MLTLGQERRPGNYFLFQRLSVRHETQALPVRGTNIDPVDLTFSPDGAWLASFVPPTVQGPLDKSVLKKIAVTGGTPMELCQAESPYGVRWEGNTVVFSTGAAIQTVSAAGGAPRTLVSVAADSNETLAQPQLLNDGRDLLYSVRGTLVFVAGDRAAAFRMVWVDREGREEAINADPKLYYLPRVSPDGTQVAVSTTDTTERDLWIWDNQRKMMTRLTNDPGEEGYPVWGRDGTSIYYRANPEGSFDVFRRAADGSGSVERLTKTPGAESPVALLPDGQRLLVRAGATIQSSDSTLMLLPSAAFRLMSVPVLPAASGAAFAYGTPKPLFDVSRYSFVSIGRTYDVAPSDQRFVFLSTQSGDANARDELSVIVNWFGDVRARVK